MKCCATSDVWFDRSICPEPCGAMHERCVECGSVVGRCAFEDKDDWADERADVLNRFTEELAKATGDGSKKRQAGTKPPWYEDDSHEGAMFSHLTKWKRGELIDADSGAHPLVHLAWRALAIACRETGNVPGREK